MYVFLNSINYLSVKMCKSFRRNYMFAFIALMVLTVFIKPVSLLADVRTIDVAASGQSFSRGVIGQSAFPRGTADPEWLYFVEQNLSLTQGTWSRGPGGGKADSYNWKDRSGIGMANYGVPGRPTLQFLREARDYQSELLATVNIRGIGPVAHEPDFVLTDTSLSTVETLAQDWVYYTNNLVFRYRQGDPITAPRDVALLNSLSWYPFDTLLKAGEANVPKIRYWEIGNEPEFPYAGFDLTTTTYRDRYKAIASAMLQEDSTIKVGPCVFAAGPYYPYLRTLLNDAQARVDFVSFHPYPWGINFHVGTFDDIEATLRSHRWHINNRKNEVVGDIIASGRNPSQIELIASEWNPSSAHWGTTIMGVRASCTMYQALGAAEFIFAFADLGLKAACYWIEMGSRDGTEYPISKLMSSMNEHMGDTLIDQYSDGDNFRLYTVRDSNTGAITLWGLNFDNDSAKNMTLNLQNLPYSPYLMSMRRLGNVSGDTILTSANIRWQSEPVDWQTIDIEQPGLSDFQVIFPSATITLIIIEPAKLVIPDDVLLYVNHFDNTTAEIAMDRLEADFARGGTEVALLSSNGNRPDVMTNNKKFGDGSVQMATNTGQSLSLLYDTKGNVNPQQGSFECWLYVEGWQNRHFTIFNFSDSSNSILIVNDGDAATRGKIEFRIRTAGSIEQVFLSSNVMPINKWFHFAADWKLDNNTNNENFIRAWLDGKKCIDVNGIVKSTMSVSDNLMMGLFSRNRTVVADDAWCGYGDEVRFTNSLISDLYIMYANENFVPPIEPFHFPICGDENHPYPVGDLNRDCRVDFHDFVLFSSYWQECASSDCY